MDSNSYKTVSANSKTVEKKWVVVDATNQILGRLSSKVAKLLRGKHKPSFTPHVDCGDNVIVINANKINLSGKKWNSKQYVRYTGYPGGQRFETAQSIYDKNPSKLIEKSVKGMLPKNKLGSVLFRNLKVYSDGEHNHDGQNPTIINLKEFK